jgi:hypothetical protein
MRKSVSAILVVLMLAGGLLFASDQFAKAEDGNLYVLAEDGTYAKFEETSYEEESGYDVNMGETEFLNMKWDSARLIKLGNTLSSRRTGTRYTTGEYYLLEFTREAKASENNDISGWKIPTLKTNKGTELNGFLSEYSEAVKSTSVNRYSTNRVKTETYTLLFECPKGETPSSIGFRKSGEKNTTWAGLSALKTFQ